MKSLHVKIILLLLLITTLGYFQFQLQGIKAESKNSELDCTKVCLNNYSDVLKCNSNKVILETIVNPTIKIDDKHFTFPIREVFKKVLHK